MLANSIRIVWVDLRQQLSSEGSVLKSLHRIQCQLHPAGIAPS
jgi:hypothetical protein